MMLRVSRINNSNRKNISPNTLKCFIILCVPILFIILSLHIRGLHGKFYHHNSFDPSYAYLFNSLNIVNGEQPGHVDHPGITVQLLGGLVLKINSSVDSFLGKHDSISSKVLYNPELYMNKISNVLISIVAISIFFFGFAVYQTTKRLYYALLGQAYSLPFSTVLEHLHRLEPEPLLVANAYLLASLLIPLVIKPEEKKDYLRWFAFMVGVLMGIGVVSKVTYAPLLLLLFIIPHNKNRLYAIIGILSSIITLTIPIWSAIPKMINWLTRLITHSGRYGQGDSGLPAVSRLIENGNSLYDAAPLLFYILFALLVIIISGTIKNKYQKYNRVNTIVFLVVAAQIITAIKHPSSDGRYLMPSMALTGFYILTIIFNLSHRYRKLLVLILSIVCVFTTYKAIAGAKMYLIECQKQHAQLLQLNKISKDIYGCRAAEYYRSSSKEYALHFANGLSKNNYFHELTELYPEYLSYNIWGKFFSNFQHRYSIKSRNNLFSDVENICLIGTISLPYKGQPSVEILEERGDFKLYKFLGWNEQGPSNYANGN